MLPDEGLLFRRRGVANQLVMTILWLGCSQAAVALRGHGVNRVSSNGQLSVPVVRAAVADSNIGHPDTGLSGRKVAGIVVGSVVGVVILVVILGLLIRCLCQRRKISSNQEKPGSTSGTHLYTSVTTVLCCELCFFWVSVCTS